MYLSLLASVRIRDGGTLHRDQLGADGHETIIIECLLRYALAGEPEFENRDRRGAVANDQRRRGASGQLPELRLRICGDLSDGLVDAHRGLKKHFHHGDSVKRLRLYVLDVIDGGGQVALRNGDYPVGQVLGLHTVVVPDNANDGDVNVRKNVRGRVNDCQRPKKEDQDSQHDNRVRFFQCQPNNPHHDLYPQFRPAWPDFSPTALLLRGLCGGWGTAAASDSGRCSPNATIRKGAGGRKWLKTRPVKEAGRKLGAGDEGLRVQRIG